LNFGLSPDFSVQLKVSLSERKAKSEVKVTQCLGGLLVIHETWLLSRAVRPPVSPVRAACLNGTTIPQTFLPSHSVGLRSLWFKKWRELARFRISGELGKASYISFQSRCCLFAKLHISCVEHGRQ